jgi:3-oxoacyl-[acyl-carrier protein] reductase
LSKVESAETLVKTTLDRFGRINALLNIAGAVPHPDDTAVLVKRFLSA